ncbi:ras-related protein rab-21-like protein [Gilbertella persicaria]|uniref:ras-related protein rab-21-like protein n=1 Tax=Gilbertella persicaria TaxID=101096 RepID=UPI00221F41DF|nr:ras-related protein rab-21-like protein [Gilbertella persicaria]KAI8077355.1 ras-related protein rab-21-like protein [Gilbertella persicaria]
MNTLEAKVVILGRTGVGKTSVALRYVKNTFSPNGSSTIGAAFMAKKLTVDDCSVRLQIWDTAGQERFRSMAPMYYRGASAAILVYDITSEESFTELMSWMEELKKNMSENLLIHIVGNKIDLESERKVPFSKVVHYCKQTTVINGVHEVSAKHDHGAIEDIFYDITQSLVKNLYDQDLYRTITSDNLYRQGTNINDKQAEKSSCC